MSQLQKLILKYPNISSGYIKQVFRETKSIPKTEAILENLNSQTKKEETKDEKVERIIKEFPSVTKVQALSYLEKNMDNVEQAIQQIREKKEIQKIALTPLSHDEEEEINHEIGESDLSHLNDIDFHKYSLRQVRYYLQHLLPAIKASQGPKCDRISIITGKGSHSKDGCAHIRRQTIKLAYQYDIHSEINPDNTGVVFIYPNENAHESDFEEEEEELFDPSLKH